MSFRIETAFLDDEEAERLYAAHPEIGRSYLKYCPTCAKTGTYRWRGQDHLCDCRHQLQLLKHYLAAGIGIPYQRLGWDDLEDTAILREVIDYAEDHDYVDRGMGLILTGTVGTGKTLAATLCLKEFVKSGYRCFSTRFSEMVDLYTAGWHSDEERKYFHAKVVESRVLLLDDVGRELRRKNALSEVTFDNVLRSRVQNGRATIITTNMTLDELGEGYGGAVLSLLREKSRAVGITGVDYRTKAKAREQQEKDLGERRPIC